MLTKRIIPCLDVEMVMLLKALNLRIIELLVIQ